MSESGERERQSLDFDVVGINTKFVAVAAPEQPQRVQPSRHALAPDRELHLLPGVARRHAVDHLRE